VGKPLFFSLRPHFHSEDRRTRSLWATLEVGAALHAVGRQRIRRIHRRTTANTVGRPLRCRRGKAIGEVGPRTLLRWLVNDQLHGFAKLSSGGDSSYSGFVEISPGLAIVSWYSSHGRDANGRTITKIYMADLEVVERLHSKGAGGSSEVTKKLTEFIANDASNLKNGTCGPRTAILSQCQILGLCQ
jgi:hypothetical protein